MAGTSPAMTELLAMTELPAMTECVAYAATPVPIGQLTPVPPRLQ
jgi:hypothetical protein